MYMRGEDRQQDELFSYGCLEERVPEDHPLRPIRTMVDEALKEMSARFDEIVRFRQTCAYRGISLGNRSGGFSGDRRRGRSNQKQ